MTALKERPAIAATVAPAHVEVRGVAVDFPQPCGAVRVMAGVDLGLPKGSFTSLIGPSGCGKSTLLNVLAGLLAPSEGTVTVNGLAPAEAARRRMIGLVFQEATLLPWRNAVQNAGFLLAIADRSLSRKAVDQRARAMLDLVGLRHAAELKPHQLSGGMRQRVAIARALALDPEVLLMDEPFGALDAITREGMSRCLLDIWQRTGKTVLLVTHSIDEAVFLSQTVHVMAGGGSARILETLAIGLGYPRGPHSFAEPAFGAAEARLRALLIEGHGQGAP